MNLIFNSNIAIIQKRWPELADLLTRQDISELEVDLRQGIESTLTVQGIQLSSRHNRAAEVSLQAASIDEAEPVIYLYGPGLGELPGSFLSRPRLKKLEVRILNESIFALVLHLNDQRSWLEDPRVGLALAAAENCIFRPYFASPPELALASNINAKIRDQLLTDIDVPFINSAFTPEDPGYFVRLNSNRSLVANDADVAELFGTLADREVWVIATGPTLDDHYDHFRLARSSDNRPFLVAVDTALVPLINQGIRPDIVVTIDPFTSPRTLPAAESDDLRLVYFPIIPHEVLAAWRGKRYAAYAATPLYEHLNKEIPRGALYVGGSVLHAAVDLAVKGGATKVLLFGADFALVDERTHGGWESGLLVPHFATTDWVLDGHGNRVKTYPNLRTYLCALECYIAAHRSVTFLNTSRKGAIIQGADYHPDFTQ